MNANIVIGLLVILTVSVSVSMFCIFLRLTDIEVDLANIASELKIANNKK
ncbi:MAG: hypothetical protein UV71_C0021G0002 [Microgenomates group bacterium GW2011_GWC1_43_13]|uniref:Uncharacterized protein n=2 Tax=Candidatus Woeseibacteriota TaxID=1752722 RepID=A0A837IBF4_9BACT|nr:MAG: hypothetical protein UV71_C0021G0002 [Microgenomates group bacterium GW2011_GWC1_43_13]KKT32168.1 MAG: hypothetical protein UW20_C0023G0001 [Candidatus Woesebacteria bacterium GW2011_GWB1_44_11]KKT54244.1 MAG: hypothetical protein UW47_C0008G0043 [Candidatus Woesebacteria bacterium GW2011_GWA1_44_23]